MIPYSANLVTFQAVACFVNNNFLFVLFWIKSGHLARIQEVKAVAPYRFMRPQEKQKQWTFRND